MKTIRSKDQTWTTAVEMAAVLMKDHGKVYAIKQTTRVFDLTPLERDSLNAALNACLLITKINED